MSKIIESFAVVLWME